MLGSKVSHYKILEKLGEGGMGVVYKAEDLKLHRTVVLKFLHSSYPYDEEGKKRLIFEAQAASALQHNNICTIHEINETADGKLFVVMDYYEGNTLQFKIGNKPLSNEDFFKIAIQIAEGISKAHSNGIVHRDIKPANIFITKDCIVKIIDFGLSKSRHQTMHTKFGIIHGTAAYMSPEQIHSEEVDFLTDIWSFGIVMFEMLTGVVPFKSEYDEGLIYLILNEEPKSIIDVRSTISHELNNLIMECLIKDKNERCQSAAEIKRKLKNIADSTLGKNTKEKKIIPIKETDKKIETTSAKKWLTLSVLGLMTIITVMLTLIHSSDQEEIDLSKYKFTPIATDAEAESNAIWSPDGKSIVYEKDINGYSQVFIRNLESPLPVQITFLNDTEAYSPFWAPGGNLIYFISEFTLYSIGLSGGEPKKIIDSVYAAAISPDSKTIAYWRPEKIKNDSASHLLSYKSCVLIYSLIKKTSRKYLPAPFEAVNCYGQSFIRFSPDGKKIGLSIYGNDCKGTEVWILPWPDGEDAEPHEIFKELNFGDSPPFSWMPDSKNMFIASRGGQYNHNVFICDIETDRFRSVIAPISGERYRGDVSPDGKRIALNRSQFNYNVAQIPLDGRKPELLISSSSSDYSLSFTKNGDKSVYISTKNGEDEIWLRSENEDIRPIVTCKGFGGNETRRFLNSNISPDGNFVAFRVGGNNLGSKIFIVSSVGGNPTRLLEGTGFEDVSSWSYDGKYLAVAINENVSIVKVGVQEEPRMLENTNDYKSWVYWSPDGNWLSYFNDENIVLISFDGKTKKLLPNPIPKGYFSRIMAWSDVGRTLYIASTHGGMVHLYSMATETGKYKVIAEYKSDLIISGFNWASIFGALSPDHKNIITTAVNYKSDIWIFEGFPEY